MFAKFNLFIPARQYSANSAGPNWAACDEHLIRSYTVCYTVIEFCLKLLFATMNVSKFRDGRVHFRNSWTERVNGEK